jgi:hypothetical protein
LASPSLYQCSEPFFGLTDKLFQTHLNPWLFGEAQNRAQSHHSMHRWGSAGSRDCRLSSVACADDVDVSRRRYARLSVCLGGWLRLRGQLQHAWILTMREQHDLAIRELKGIMVRMWIFHVDLPEPSHRVTDVLRFPLEKAQLKSSNLTLDFAFERNLGAGKKAHGYLGFPNRRKPARRGIPKFRRDQLVSDLRRSGRNNVQTIVPHGRGSPILAVPANLFHSQKDSRPNHEAGLGASR